MASVEGRAETLASVHSTLRESFVASDIAENHPTPRSLARVTLAAVLSNERRSTPDRNVVRTLLDIIRAEETITRHQFTGKPTWKSFMERLKLRRNAADTTTTCSVSWMPTASAPEPDAIAPQLQILSQNSLRESLQLASSSGAEEVNGEDDNTRRRSIRLSDALAAEREERSRMSRELQTIEEEGSSGDVVEPEPVRMSLMDLLEETERQSWGLQGSIYRPDDVSGDNDHGDVQSKLEEEDGGEERAARVSEVSCCVCMVRNKGAAFIPCGHTFCRMCSRELWVQRGHCPLCNSFILEILDIF